jgi:hypothetical protein
MRQDGPSGVAFVWALEKLFLLRQLKKPRSDPGLSFFFRRPRAGGDPEFR